jgi:hypothetical protein
MQRLGQARGWLGAGRPTSAERRACLVAEETPSYAVIHSGDATPGLGERLGGEV